MPTTIVTYNKHLRVCSKTFARVVRHPRRDAPLETVGLALGELDVKERRDHLLDVTSFDTALDAQLFIHDFAKFRVGVDPFDTAQWNAHARRRVVRRVLDDEKCFLTRTANENSMANIGVVPTPPRFDRDESVSFAPAKPFARHGIARAAQDDMFPAPARGVVHNLAPILL